MSGRYFKKGVKMFNVDPKNNYGLRHLSYTTHQQNTPPPSKDALRMFRDFPYKPLTSNLEVKEDLIAKIKKRDKG